MYAYWLMLMFDFPWTNSLWSCSLFLMWLLLNYNPKVGLLYRHFDTLRHLAFEFNPSSVFAFVQYSAWQASGLVILDWLNQVLYFGSIYFILSKGDFLRLLYKTVVQSFYGEKPKFCFTRRRVQLSIILG